jgi:hypothetical protein
VTVVDFIPIEKHPHGEGEVVPAGGRAVSGGGAGGVGHWKSDLRGAIVYATWQLMQRDAKVTSAGVEPHGPRRGASAPDDEHADKSRTFAGRLHARKQAVHHRRDGAAGYPAPALFQDSLGWLDENGIGLRYQAYYSNNYPAPPRVGRAGQAQTQGQDRCARREPDQSPADQK